MNYYKIAGHVLSIDLPDEYIHPDLVAFRFHDTAKAELSIRSELNSISIEEARAYLVAHISERLLLSHYMIVIPTTDGYRVFYNDDPEILYCDINTTSWNVVIQLTTEKPKESACSGCSGAASTSNCSSCSSAKQQNDSFEPDTIEPKMELRDYLLYVIRDVFFTFGQSVGLLPVHSSSIIYNNHAYLFSASSGTGKTTHTNMWVERYGVEILDGDVSILSCEDGQCYAYGLPWCGTSKQYQNKRVPLGGIIFLAQAKENSVERLSTYNAILSITSRSFAPTWTKELTDKSLDLAQHIAENTPCYRLRCLPNQEAVELIKQSIDENN